MTRLVIQQLGDASAGDHTQTFEDGLLVADVAGIDETADVVVVAAEEPGRMPTVHARVDGRLIEGVFPPRGPQPRELDVFDADQRATGVATCATEAWGDARIVVRIVGDEVTMDEAVAEVDPAEVDIAVKVGIADFLAWIHLETSLAPAMWFSHQIFEVDLFISSLFDGVVAERPAQPLAGPVAMRRAVDLVCSAAGCLSLLREVSSTAA